MENLTHWHIRRVSSNKNPSHVMPYNKLILGPMFISTHIANMENLTHWHIRRGMNNSSV